jgi:NAD(P)-dependent dehydrogenase (short-subunit alcohol dehydrogenase family)
MHWYVEGQVIAITGGSRGIGFATAQALAERGAKVALLARNEQTLAEAVVALGDERAMGIAVDVCSKADFDRALDQVMARWGRLDGLINNAGFQFSRRIEIMPEQEVRHLVEINFLSAVFGCQCAIPKMRKGGGGRIVNISSASVHHDNEFAHLSMYSASKAALEHFSKELREEVKKDGIMVTVFSPGSTGTGSIANFDPAAVAEAMAAWLEKGPTFDGGTEPAVMGAAIAQCFEMPPGVAVEFMEVRPNIPAPKQLETDWEK